MDKEKKRRLIAIQEELASLMMEEVGEMRELLTSMAAENRCLTFNDDITLKSLMKSREQLLDKIFRIQGQRNMWLDTLKGLCGNSEYVDWKSLLKVTQNESFAILAIKDQIIDLINNVKRQNDSNQYLITHKLNYTKNIFDNIHKRNSIYFANNQTKPKVRVKTIDINFFNQEG